MVPRNETMCAKALELKGLTESKEASREGSKLS